MTKHFNFFEMDLNSGNELCFECERSGCAKKMCSWIAREEPVPGWVAIRAGELPEVWSYKIFRCPLFLDSKDDPGMTREEYDAQRQGLLVELYSKLKEYKELYLSANRERRRASGQLICLRKEFKALQRKQELLNLACLLFLISVHAFAGELNYELTE